MTKDDWSALLASAHNDNLGVEPGVMFDRTRATLWLVEGLIMYIPEVAVDAYVSCVDTLSTTESAFIFDGLKSREQFSILADIPSNFMASLADNALHAFHRLGWQVSHTVHNPETDSAFYTMSKRQGNS